MKQRPLLITDDPNADYRPNPHQAIIDFLLEKGMSEATIIKLLNELSAGDENGFSELYYTSQITTEDKELIRKSLSQIIGRPV